MTWILLWTIATDVCDPCELRSSDILTSINIVGYIFHYVLSINMVYKIKQVYMHAILISYTLNKWATSNLLDFILGWKYFNNKVSCYYSYTLRRYIYQEMWSRNRFVVYKLIRNGAKYLFRIFWKYLLSHQNHY